MSYPYLLVVPQSMYISPYLFQQNLSFDSLFIRDIHKTCHQHRDSYFHVFRFQYCLLLCSIHVTLHNIVYISNFLVLMPFAFIVFIIFFLFKRLNTFRSLLSWPGCAYNMNINYLAITFNVLRIT